MPVPRAPVISNFNPRSPHGERLEAAEPLVVNRHFNPRSPHGERHLVQWGNLRHVLISIHAPRTGSDVGSLQVKMAAIDFNPRSPHGERHKAMAQMEGKTYFNPRSPHGERRPLYSRRHKQKNFNPRSPHGERPEDAPKEAVTTISIHAPRTGSDVSAIFSLLQLIDFNPRSPHGERPH